MIIKNITRLEYLSFLNETKGKSNITLMYNDGEILDTLDINNKYTDTVDAYNWLTTHLYYWDTDQPMLFYLLR